MSLQEQRTEDGFASLRELIEHNAELLRAEMARGFAEEAQARAELELRLKAQIQASADRLEAKFDTQFRLLLMLQGATFALLTGVAIKLMWP